MKTIAVICAYNESNTVTDIVHGTDRVLKEYGGDYGIIVVDDGSTDGTYEKLIDLKSEIPYLKVIQHRKNRGYGAAMCTGLLETKKEKPSQFVTLDADGQHNPGEIPKLLDALNEADLVIGSPVKTKDKCYGALKNIWRKGFTFLINSLYPFNKLSYTTGGMKAGNSIALNVIDLPSYMDGFSPSEIMVLKASLKKLRIVNVPVVYQERKGGRSFINLSYPLMNIPMIGLILITEILRQSFYGLPGTAHRYNDRQG